MKVITMYLPQFHSIPENDRWWGKGYTEWTAVKTASPLFENHAQPRVPMDKNYYNLLDVDALKWQASLMKKYGVDGQCFYHYYFKDGKKVLEKPAELLLNNKDVDMSFCFSWANETWARSWSRISSGNSWNNQVEEQHIGDTEDDGVLLLQDYGDKYEWKRHLEYLIPFFRDDRYIKMNGLPIFVIHKPNDIWCLKEMVEFWKTEILKYGINGICIIGNNTDSSIVDLKLQMESNYSCNKMPEKFYNYEQACDNIIANAYLSDKSTILCGTPGYDDTPRRGGSGEILLDATPKSFGKQMSCLMKLTEDRGNEIVFINAWNEWGEGMYLEPDELSGYSYLEELLRAKQTYKKLSVNDLNKHINSGLAECNRLLKVRLNKSDFQNKIMNKIINEYNSEQSELYDKLKGKKIAIYGYGIVGKQLRRLLNRISIEVQCVIDRTAIGNDIIRPDDHFPELDMIILTVLSDIENVKYELKEKSGIEPIHIDSLLL